MSRKLPFGACVGIALPDVVDDAAWAIAAGALHADELAFAASLAPGRRATWVGGRVALRRALGEIGRASAAAILSTSRGAPLLPPETGATGSISHTRALAVALAAPTNDADAFTLGVDVETLRTLRQDIARHVLTPAERATLSGPGPHRDAEVLLRFSAKEAIYKALDPWVGRFVSFQEAEIAHAPGGGLVATLALTGGEGPFTVELIDASVADQPFILVAARVRRAPR